MLDDISTIIYMPMAQMLLVIIHIYMFLQASAAYKCAVVMVDMHIHFLFSDLVANMFPHISSLQTYSYSDS